MHSGESVWTRLHRRVVRGWMVAGAIVFGLAQSPTYAQLMQPRGEMEVVVIRGASTPVQGEEDGPQALRPPTPAPSFDPCGDLGGLDATDQLVATLEAARAQQSIAGMRAALPVELHAGFDDALAAPGRFYMALFSDIATNPPLMPTYVLGGEPVAEETQRALANTAHGFDATFVDVEKLDLAWGFAEAKDPTLTLNPGDEAWNVTGVGERNGAVAEFTGMVVATKTNDGPLYVLIVETDSICQEPETLEMMGGSTGGPLGIMLDGPMGASMEGEWEGGGSGPMGLVQDPQDPFPIPPGLPPLAWPGLPDIGGFGGPWWNQDCLKAKYKEYHDKTLELLRALADAIKQIKDYYAALLIRIVTTIKTIRRIIQALMILKALRDCLVLLVFGFWGALLCMAEVIIIQILIYYIVKLIIKIIKKILWASRDHLIRMAILAFQWAMYHLYNQIMSDISRDCYTGPRSKPEQMPPPYPQIPQPPWWPVDPNGPYRPH